MQEHALLEDEDEDEDENMTEPPVAGNAESLADAPSQSPEVQSATSPSGIGLKVQWRWPQKSHPEQGVTCMAWNQVRSHC